MPFVSTATSNPAAMEGFDKGRVELQQRFSPRADHKARAGALPQGERRGDQIGRGGKTPASWTVHADEIGVAEGADRARPILLAP